MTVRKGSTKGVLTPRQRQVLTLVANGHSNPEIARLLFITSDTVGGILSRAYDTLGVEDRANAVAVAIAIGEIRLHWITIPDKQWKDAA